MALDSISGVKKYKPIVLIILDGWGLSPSWGGNAIAMNNPRNINSYWKDYPHAVLQAFKPISENIRFYGNSEIGHASIGTGRLIKPDLIDINDAIKNNTFFDNFILKEAMHNSIDKNSNLHLIGMVSDGNVHSCIEHLFALMEMAKKEKVKNVYIHAITDGRDVEATSSIEYINKIEKKIQEIGIGEIATITGRDYALDRQKKWNKIEATYQAQVLGKGRIEKDALSAISNLYKDGFTDEFIPPTVIYKNNKPMGLIKNNDSVIFFNFRADRAQELTKAYVDPKIFKNVFVRKYPLLKIFFVSFTDYKINSNDIDIAFNSQKIDSNLAKIFSNHGFKQIHIAESEKYAHITYFLNGGYEKPFKGEDRVIVPSLNIDNYDEKPEMSIKKISEKTLAAIKSKKYNFIVINIANVDMISHTGNIIAASEAVKIVDREVKKIVEETKKNDGAVIITADHGNAEQMINIKQFGRDPETYHTLNPVPFILIAKDLKKNLFKSAYKSEPYILSDILDSKNTIADIAPTILEILDIAKPTDMTGKSLMKKLE